MLKVAVIAPGGKMAGLIIQETVKRNDLELWGAVGPAGRDYIGEDAGIVSGLGRKIGLPVTDDPEKIIKNCDAVIDFSRVDVSMKILTLCKKHKKSLVCGTTGFSKEQEEEFIKAAETIPVVKAANTSYMVNVMTALLKEAAVALEGSCKIEIIDMHDENKIDAPSGTALEMATAIESAAPQKSCVEYHSVRAGDIPSSHTVIFGGMGERLEITHHAYNWKCYAAGACRAVIFVAGKNPGLYTMEDVAKI